MTDFSLDPLLLPQLASDSFQNVPFCSGERGLQGHTLLAPPTPSPPQPYFQPSPSTPEPLPDPGRYEISTFRKIENIFSKNPSIQFPEWKVSTMKKWISIISVVKRGSLLPFLQRQKKFLRKKNSRKKTAVITYKRKWVFCFSSKKSQFLPKMLLSCLLHATGASGNTCKEVCCANICPRCCFFSFLSAEISRMVRLRASEAVFHFWGDSLRGRDRRARAGTVWSHVHARRGKWCRERDRERERERCPRPLLVRLLRQAANARVPRWLKLTFKVGVHV